METQPTLSAERKVLRAYRHESVEKRMGKNEILCDGVLSTPEIAQLPLGDLVLKRPSFIFNQLLDFLPVDKFLIPVQAAREDLALQPQSPTDFLGVN